jgi:hypothetical protein
VVLITTFMGSASAMQRLPVRRDHREHRTSAWLDKRPQGHTMAGEEDQVLHPKLQRQVPIASSGRRLWLGSEPSRMAGPMDAVG